MKFQRSCQARIAAHVFPLVARVQAHLLASEIQFEVEPREQLSGTQWNRLMYKISPGLQHAQYPIVVRGRHEDQLKSIGRKSARLRLA